MEPSNVGGTRAGLEMRGSRASSVIVHEAPPDKTDRFLEWQEGITRAAQDFAGYLGTDVYPPAGDRRNEWVAVIHFDTPESLQAWIDSTVRAEWTSKLRRDIGEFHMKTLPAGFGSWFAGMVSAEQHIVPPPWKMVLCVLLGLYPTVMLLSIFVGPYTLPLGLAVSMLIGNALSVAILQWLVMPSLTKLLEPWLQAKRFSAFSVAILLAGLVSLALLFRQVTG